MKIEPEALYSLYDTLFLPIEKEVSIVKNTNKKPSNKRLWMLFDKEYTKDEGDFLNKILSAINIKHEEFETKFEVTQETLLEIIEENSGHILVWGIDYSKAEKYKLLKKGQASIILSDSLSMVKNDQTLKAKLWNCLKEEFVK